jgi:hypothetical protein
MKPLAWLAALLGIAAFARRLRRRRETPPSPPDPAEELRRKLDESRSIVSEREEFEAAETPVDQAQPAAGLDERRRQVHDHGRAAVEEMRQPAQTEEVDA